MEQLLLEKTQGAQVTLYDDNGQPVSQQALQQPMPLKVVDIELD